MKYKKRIVDILLENNLKTFGATLIVGPKGCGKTTSARQKAKSCIEFQNEDERDNLLNIVSMQPSKLLNGDKPILFDEWQDAPKIWGSIRKYVDDHNSIGDFILTGSSSKFVNVPHTGTGRISTLKMYPMSLYESKESNGTISLRYLFDHKDISHDYSPSKLKFDDLIFAICRGGWPRSLNVDKDRQLNIAKDIFKQTCSIDIVNINGVKRNEKVVRQLLKSYARNICTPADNVTILNDINSVETLSRPSFYDYTYDLEKLHIIEDVEPWFPAIRSKSVLRMRRKRNFVDPSIAVAALGISPKILNTDFKTLGLLFECLCIRDLKIYSSLLDGYLSYYRDKTGLEADAVLHLEDGRYALIEIKLGANKFDESAKNLNKIEDLIKIYNQKNNNKIRMPDLKIIITGTEYAFKREDEIFVIPIGCLKD